MTNRKLFSRFLATFYKHLPTRIRTYLGVSHTGHKYPYWVCSTWCNISDEQSANVSYIYKKVLMEYKGYLYTWTFPNLSDREFIETTELITNCKHSSSLK
jgi:hypothetical protein